MKIAILGNLNLYCYHPLSPCFCFGDLLHVILSDTILFTDFTHSIKQNLAVWRTLFTDHLELLSRYNATVSTIAVEEFTMAVNGTMFE